MYIYVYIHTCIYVYMSWWQDADGWNSRSQLGPTASERGRVLAKLDTLVPAIPYLYIYICICVCVCVCVYVCVCVCVRVCVYIDALSLLHGFCALCPVSLAPSPRRTLSHSFHASLNALYYSVG